MAGSNLKAPRCLDAIVVGELNSAEAWRAIDLGDEARRVAPSIPHQLARAAKAAVSIGPRMVGFRNYDAAHDILQARKLRRCQR